MPAFFINIIQENISHFCLGENVMQISEAISVVTGKKIRVAEKEGRVIHGTRNTLVFIQLFLASLVVFFLYVR